MKREVTGPNLYLFRGTLRFDKVGSTINNYRPNLTENNPSTE